MILNLTEEELNLIVGALGRMPYVEVFRLVSNLQEQYQKQTNVKDEKPSS